MQNLVPKALLSHYSNSVFFFILLQSLSFTDTFFYLCEFFCSNLLISAVKRFCQYITVNPEQPSRAVKKLPTHTLTHCSVTQEVSK